MWWWRPHRKWVRRTDFISSFWPSPTFTMRPHPRKWKWRQRRQRRRSCQQQERRPECQAKRMLQSGVVNGDGWWPKVLVDTKTSFHKRPPPPKWPLCFYVRVITRRVRSKTAKPLLPTLVEQTQNIIQRVIIGTRASSGQKKWFWPRPRTRYSGQLERFNIC